MYRITRGLLYGIFFVLMGITLYLDTLTTEELSVVMSALDNVYGAGMFSMSFIVMGLLNMFLGITQRKWQLIGFAPFILYGVGVFHVSIVNGSISIFGNLVFALLVSIMLADWFLDTGVIQYFRRSNTGEV